MKKEKTSKWDAANHLETETDMVAYVEAALEENDPLLLAAVLEDIARAKIAKRARIATRSIRKQAHRDGLDTMTAEEIDEIVRKARAERKIYEIIGIAQAINKIRNGWFHQVL
jgi:DNA-binding phage protein